MGLQRQKRAKKRKKTSLDLTLLRIWRGEESIDLPDHRHNYCYFLIIVPHSRRSSLISDSIVSLYVPAVPFKFESIKIQLLEKWLCFAEELELGEKNCSHIMVKCSLIWNLICKFTSPGIVLAYPESCSSIITRAADIPESEDAKTWNPYEHN